MSVGRTDSMIVASLLLALAVFPAHLAASMVQDTSTLRFRGFRAGAPLTQLDAVVRRSGGSGLGCARASRDPRVSECRAALEDSAAGRVGVWVSAMDSVAGVITLSAALDSTTLQGWRRELERRYGTVGVKRQGGQSMMQWVRRGRMLRLTWRSERGGLVASVSLVDGRVLDAWGAGRARESS